MSTGFAFNQDVDSDDEDQAPARDTGREATILIIDCSASMFVEFEEDENTTSLFTKCLSVLERLLLNKIINNSKDLVRFDMFPPKFPPKFSPLNPFICNCNFSLELCCTTLISRRIPMAR